MKKKIRKSKKKSKDALTGLNDFSLEFPMKIFSHEDLTLPYKDPHIPKKIKQSQNQNLNL